MEDLTSSMRKTLLSLSSLMEVATEAMDMRLPATPDTGMLRPVGSGLAEQESKPPPPAREPRFFRLELELTSPLGTPIELLIVVRHGQ